MNRRPNDPDVVLKLLEDFDLYRLGPLRPSDCSAWLDLHMILSSPGGCCPVHGEVHINTYSAPRTVLASWWCTSKRRASEGPNSCVQNRLLTHRCQEASLVPLRTSIWPWQSSVSAVPENR